MPTDSTAVNCCRNEAHVSSPRGLMGVAAERMSESEEGESSVEC